MLTTRATLLAAVIGVLALTLVYPLRLYLQQREEIVELSAQNAEQQRRLDELRRSAARYDDPAWVEDEARRRLHYMRPGEQAYLMPAEAEPSPTPPAAAGTNTGRPAWYGRLWSELSEAATPTPTPATPAKPAP
jgi:cell division protein FtsB